MITAVYLKKAPGDAREEDRVIIEVDGPGDGTGRRGSLFSIDQDGAVTKLASAVGMGLERLYEGEAWG